MMLSRRCLSSKQSLPTRFDPPPVYEGMGLLLFYRWVYIVCLVCVGREVSVFGSCVVGIVLIVGIQECSFGCL